MSLSEFRFFLEGFAILFYAVLSLLFGPCRLSEFTLVVPLYSPACGHKLNGFDKASAETFSFYVHISNDIPFYQAGQRFSGHLHFDISLCFVNVR